jgi:hypothetical protein
MAENQQSDFVDSAASAPAEGLAALAEEGATAVLFALV